MDVEIRYHLQRRADNWKDIHVQPEPGNLVAIAQGFNALFNREHGAPGSYRAMVVVKDPNLAL